MKNSKYLLISFFLILFISELKAQTNCSSFRLEAGEKYIVSAWVKEDHITQVQTYTMSSLIISFQGSIESYPYTPKGAIIDGWQRIIGIFIVPASASDVNIELNSTNLSGTSYFDDIRIHPFNGNMKSFVYDPQTQRLMAELDENNYATLYEYDSEGGLVRVKKETEKGVYAIQETRSGNSKINN